MVDFNTGDSNYQTPGLFRVASFAEPPPPFCIYYSRQAAITKQHEICHLQCIAHQRHEKS